MAYHRYSPNQRSPAGKPPGELPPGYLRNGYFDSKGNILPQLIQDWAQHIARTLFSSKPQMTSSQLRGNFFAEVRRLERKLVNTDDFEKIRPEILKLKAFAENARKKRKVPGLFKLFIDENVKWAQKGRKEFCEGFVNHFECVVAYYPETKRK